MYPARTRCAGEVERNLNKRPCLCSTNEIIRGAASLTQVDSGVDTTPVLGRYYIRKITFTHCMTFTTTVEGTLCDTDNLSKDHLNRIFNEISSGA